jgi:hypothetical protein
VFRRRSFCLVILTEKSCVPQAIFFVDGVVDMRGIVSDWNAIGIPLSFVFFCLLSRYVLLNNTFCSHFLGVLNCRRTGKALPRAHHP